MSLEDHEVEAHLDRADEDRKRAKEEPPVLHSPHESRCQPESALRECGCANCAGELERIRRLWARDARA